MSHSKEYKLLIRLHSRDIIIIYQCVSIFYLLSAYFSINSGQKKNPVIIIVIHLYFVDKVAVVKFLVRT